MTCSQCKHFNQSDNYPAHLGWCELQLPPWFYKLVGLTQWGEIDKTVRCDDACSFLEKTK